MQLGLFIRDCTQTKHVPKFAPINYIFLIHVIFVISFVLFTWNNWIQYNKKLYQILDFIV